MEDAGVHAEVVVAEDLWDLPEALSTAVVDEIVEGHDFPMVAVGGRVICVGGIDMDSVVRELAGD